MAENSGRLSYLYFANNSLAPNSTNQISTNTMFNNNPLFDQSVYDQRIARKITIRSIFNWSNLNMTGSILRFSQMSTRWWTCPRSSYPDLQPDSISRTSRPLPDWFYGCNNKNDWAVVKWSACSPSIPTIRFRIPLKPTVFFCIICVWKEQKDGGVGPFLKKNNKNDDKGSGVAVFGLKWHAVPLKFLFLNNDQK